MSDEETPADGTLPDGALPEGALAAAEPTCRNCEASVEGRFCSVCGQRFHGGPLRMGVIIHEFWRSSIDVDRGFVRTFVGLLRDPGGTVREYVDGKRVVHSPPLRYYVIMVAVWFATPAILGFDFTAYMAEEFEKVRSGAAGMRSGFEARLMAQLEEATQLTYSWRRWTGFFTLPVYALAGWLLSRKSKRTFAEWLAFALYVTAQMLLVQMAGIALMAADLPSVNAVFSLIAIPYFIWAYRGFTRDGIWWSILKGTIAYFGAGMVVGTGVFVVAMLLTS